MRWLLLAVATWSGTVWGSSSLNDLEELFSSDLEYRHCRIALEDDSEFGLVVWVHDNDYDPFGTPVMEVNISNYELQKDDDTIELKMENTKTLSDHKFGYSYGKVTRTLRLTIDEETREVTSFEFYREKKYDLLHSILYTLVGRSKQGRDKMTSCNE